jgi:hypothetical protein
LNSRECRSTRRRSRAFPEPREVSSLERRVGAAWDWSTSRASQGLSNKVFPLAPWHRGQPLSVNLRPTRKASAVGPGAGPVSMREIWLPVPPVVRVSIAPSPHHPITQHRLHRLPSLDEGSSTALQRARCSTSPDCGFRCSAFLFQFRIRPSRANKAVGGAESQRRTT